MSEARVEELVRAVVAAADRVAARAPFADVIDDRILSSIIDELLDARRS